MEILGQASVDLHAGATFDISISYDPTLGLAAGEAISIQIDRLVPEITLGANDIQLGAKLGFLGLGIENGEVSLNAEASVLVNNGEPVTLSELLDRSLSEMITIEEPTAFFRCDPADLCCLE